MAPLSPVAASRSRAIARVVLWLGGLGLLTRLLYFAEHARSAFFNVPILDEKFYDALARTLLEGGDVWGLNPGFRPLLYPLFLAGWYRIGGEWGRVLALVVQHLLGVVTAVVVAALAVRLYRRASAGALAGGLYLLAGPPLYFEGELLITTLFTFLVMVQLALFSRAELRPGAAGWWLGAGMATALAAQARPNVLVFLAAYPLVAARSRSAPRRTRAALAAAALSGAVIVLVAFAGLHAGITGRIQWLGGAGGVNFYLGNKAGADGMVPRQDRAVTCGDEYRDSVQVFAVEVYRAERGGGETEALAAGQVSRYWTRRAVAEIRRDPRRWLGLMTRKLWFLAWNREIPNNKTYAFVCAHESALLRILPVRWWLLFSLAPLGFLWAWRRGDRDLAVRIGAFVVLYASGVVVFFVNSRYRIPLWPVLAIFAGGGAMALADALGGRRFRELLIALLAAGALAATSLVNWLGIPPPSYARDFFFRSLAHLDKGAVEAAAADARQSVELDPGDPAAWLQLGTTALAAGRYDRALPSLRRAVALAPGEPRVHNNLGVALDHLGRPAEAYRAYRQAIELADSYSPPLVNAALLELRAGRLEAAEARVRRAEELGFESVSLVCARAFVERDRGREERSLALLARARELDSVTVDRLIEENRRPLALAD